MSTNENEPPVGWWQATATRRAPPATCPWSHTLHQQVYEDEIGRIVIRDHPHESGSIVSVEDKTDGWVDEFRNLTHHMYALKNCMRSLRPPRPHLLAFVLRAETALKQDRVRKSAAVAQYWRDRLADVTGPR